MLSIGCNSFSPDSIQLIIERLVTNHSNFSSENVLSLASVLRVNTMLKELDIGQCNIQSSDSVYLANALKENTTSELHTIWLSGNPIKLQVQLVLLAC